MAHDVVLITPTRKVGSEGFFEAEVQMAVAEHGEYRKVGNPWHSDSIHFHGVPEMDFENNGEMVVWSRDNKILVREAYTTNIYCGEEAINEYLK